MLEVLRFRCLPSADDEVALRPCTGMTPRVTTMPWNSFPVFSAAHLESPPPDDSGEQGVERRLRDGTIHAIEIVPADILFPAHLQISHRVQLGRSVLALLHQPHLVGIDETISGTSSGKIYMESKHRPRYHIETTL